MVVSQIVNFETIRKKPGYIFFVAMFFVFLGFLFAFFIFPSAFSIAMVSFTSILILPFIIKVIEGEKAGRKKDSGFFATFKEHDKTILLFIFMFFGMAIEYTLLFGFMAPDIGAAAFESQIELVFGAPLGQFIDPGFFWEIISNNIAIVLICFVLSLFYGSGAIFILTYNASVVGMIYGSSIRALVWGTPQAAFMNPLLYIPHTVIEITGFLFAAVAGSILLRGMVLGNLSQARFTKHALVLLAVSIALIFIAGYVECVVPFL